MPKKIEGLALSPHEIEVRWTFPHFEYFSPGLFHQVKVCPVNLSEEACIIKVRNSSWILNPFTNIITYLSNALILLLERVSELN